MQVIILIFTFAYLTSAAVLQDDELYENWLNFKREFNKSYKNSNEEGPRFSKFKQNLQTIKEHNKRFEKGEVSYRMGVNPYTDMDILEIQNKKMGVKYDKKSDFLYSKYETFNVTDVLVDAIPTFKDWRQSGAITAVKDQKSCGSCWAFSSIASLESFHFLKTQQLITLSEQQLLDCVTTNNGCSGGWMANAFEYIRVNGGINTQASYPYESAQKTCRFKSASIAATCSGFVKTTPGDENQLLQAVALKGPVSVAIDVPSTWSHYAGGVYDDSSCRTNVPLHAVLVAGYGTENGKDYWLVKNSWGASWGQQGYIKMVRNKSNQCGIATWPVYPIV